MVPRWFGTLSALAALAASALTAVAAAQPPTQSPQLIPRSHEERERRYEQQHRMVLNVEVVDPSGNPVKGLRAEDFTLLDNGEPRPIATFHSVEDGAVTRPAQIVLILDAVNNSAKGIASDREQIESYLKNGPALEPFPMSVAVVSAAGARMSPPQRGQTALLSALHDLTENLHPIHCSADPGPDDAFVKVWMGGTAYAPASSHELECQNRRFAVSVSSLRDLAHRQMDLPGRAIFIWVGPGWPLLSGSQFKPDDAAIKGNLFRGLVGVSQALREAQVTLNVLSPSSFLRETDDQPILNDAFFAPVEKQEQVTAAKFSALVLARQSGGQTLVDSKDFSRGVAACVADADAFYQITFDSPQAADFGEFHSLTLRVDRPGLKVRTDTMYYAEQ